MTEIKFSGSKTMAEELTPKEKEFLKELGKERKEGDSGIPVYVVRGPNVYFIRDFPLPTGQNKRFEKESPESLFRGGVVGIMRYKGKYLAVPDERSQWFKPLPAGIAKFNEGADLTIGARRELMEEVFIISQGNVKDAGKKDRAVRYVPAGLKAAVTLYNSALDLTAIKSVEVGQMNVLGYTLNTTNKAFECVFAWDLPDDLKDFTISLNEDWFAGGNSGISVFALNPDGSLYGVFSGQQGLQPISEYKIHETLIKYLPQKGVATPDTPEIRFRAGYPDVLSGISEVTGTVQVLNPINTTTYTDRFNSQLGQLGDMVEKRIGGGRVQIGLMTFDKLADAVIPAHGGHDKQAKTQWNGKAKALARIFEERGLVTFNRAVSLAVVEKYAVDPKDGFIPLAPGSIDVEAGLNIAESLHAELLVHGTVAPPDQAFAQAVSKKVGVACEYGNGDSFEIVVPLYTPGAWKKISDATFDRRTGMVLVTPYLTIYLGDMSINRFFPSELPIFSVKVKEAIKIAKQLCRELSIR